MHVHTHMSAHTHTRVCTYTHTCQWFADKTTWTYDFKTSMSCKKFYTHIYVYTYVYIYTYTYITINICAYMCMYMLRASVDYIKRRRQTNCFFPSYSLRPVDRYGVATISRLLKSPCLFCRISSLL